jgi:hypothetical protein
MPSTFLESCREETCFVRLAHVSVMPPSANDCPESSFAPANKLEDWPLPARRDRLHRMGAKWEQSCCADKFNWRKWHHKVGRMESRIVKSSVVERCRAMAGIGRQSASGIQARTPSPAKMESHADTSNSSAKLQDSVNHESVHQQRWVSVC